MVKAGGSKQKKQEQKQEKEEEGGGGGLMRRKGPWTEQEDVQLVWFVRRLGQRRWDLLAKVSGLQRSGKSCRLRWVNYLQPGLKRGRMSPEEERLVVQLQAKWGNCWSRIAKAMPGRTDNHIKNYWRTHLRNATKPQRHCSSKHQHQASSSDDTRHGHLQLSCELELELDDDQAATPASHQELELCMDDQDQQQLLRYMPLWNDDMIDVHCWSNSCSNAIVDDVAPAPMPMPASPLWDDGDVAYYCGSDYSLW